MRQSSQVKGISYKVSDFLGETPVAKPGGVMGQPPYNMYSSIQAIRYINASCILRQAIITIFIPQQLGQPPPSAISQVGWLDGTDHSLTCY